MNTETVLGHILPVIQAILKDVVSQMSTTSEAPTLYDLEAQTQAALPRIGQAILQGAVEGQGSGVEGPLRSCPCGQEQGYHDQARPLTLQTSVGDIQLNQRAYYHCRACGANGYPLDERLGLGHAGRMSRYLQEQCGWLLALLPARVAQQTLRRFGWPAISASLIREHGEALGAELEEREQESQAAARVAAASLAHQPLPRQPAQCQRLYAAPDGVMYCTTERDPETNQMRWRELKVAAVYEVEATDQPEPAPVRARIQAWLRQEHPEADLPGPDQAKRVSYVAQTGPWEQFGQRLWAELWARGLGRPVKEVVVVADGADHIDHVVENELRLPHLRLTRILDIAHAQQHLWDVSKAAFGEGSAAGLAWVQGPLTALERGAVEEVVDGLAALAQERESDTPAVAQVARKAGAYFRQRRAQVDYPRFVAAGYQIGSGLAESACKRFGTDRMKGAGMRWTVPGAQCVATLRLFVLSERWEEVTAHCRQAA